MIKKPFEIWLETLKRHVATIEKHDTLDRNTMKFVFEHAIAHLVLGWSMVSDRHSASSKKGDGLIAALETSVRFGGQAKANREGVERVAAAEVVPLWWQAGDRFEKFVEYVAKVLGMSTSAPYETIFNRLSEVSGSTTKARRIWKMVSKRSHVGPDFAEAVACLVGSDLKNADVRDDLAPEVWKQHNLSILLGNVEKFLRDRGFVPVKLVATDVVTSVSRRQDKKGLKKSKSSKK